MEEAMSIKLCQPMYDKTCRRIWNAYAPKRSYMRFIFCYILVVFATKNLTDFSFIKVIADILVLEIIILLYVIRAPRKIRKRLTANFIEEVKLCNNSIEIGNMRIPYESVKKVVLGEQFAIIKADRMKLILTYEKNEDISLLYDNLRYYCGYRAKFVSEKKHKQTERAVLSCAFIAYICVAIHAVWLVVNYDGLVEEYKTKFKEVYDIELYIHKETQEIGDYIIYGASSKYEILNTLKSIDNMLERFPKDIFRELDVQLDDTEIINTQLKIYISCDIEKQGEGKLKPAGVTIKDLPNYNVYIDCEGWNVSKIFAHEMFHVIDGITGDIQLGAIKDMVQDLLSDGTYSVDEITWNHYNPPDFIYYENRIFGNTRGWKDDDSYTNREDNIEDVYFVSNYAKSAMNEDMAEVFKYLVSCDDSLPSSFDSPHVRAKAEYLIKWLDDTFDCVTEDVYWNKWFR